MKKILMTLLALILAACVFAADVSDGGAYKGVVTTPFGTALAGNSKSLSYKLYKNPAALATNKFVLEIPSVSASVYNIANTMADPSGAQALSNILNGGFNTENAIKLGVVMLENIGNGKNSFIGVNPGFGFASGGFALGFDARGLVRTMPSQDSSGSSSSSQSLVTTNLVPVVDGAITAAVGLRVYEKGSSYLDVGVSARYALKYFVTDLNAKTVIDNLQEGTEFSLEGKLVGGYAIPFDFGAVYGVADGKIRFSAAVNNLNGYYRMKTYDSLQNAITMKNGYSATTLYTPWTVSAAFEYEPGWKVVSPLFYLGFDDINGYIAEDLDGSDGKRALPELVRHLTARIDLRIVKVIKLSAAFSNGYPELGAALDLWGNRIEVCYGYHEAGTLYGSKPVDCLTVRVKLGFDSN